MFKGNFRGTLAAVIGMIMGVGIVGCTNVVPKVAILRNNLTSNKVVFDSFVPPANPSNDLSQKSVKAYGSGFSAFKMMLINATQSCSQADFSNASESATGVLEFTPSSDGSYVVCAIGKVSSTGQWQDVSDAATSSVLEIDTTAPENNSFIINDGGVYTTNTLVTLHLSSAGATQAYISQTSCDADGAWQTYAATSSYTLLHENALNTVYIKYRDAALNETACLQQQITHDNIPPTTPVLNSPSQAAVFNATSNLQTNLTISCEPNSIVSIQGPIETLTVNCPGTSTDTQSLNLNSYPQGNLNFAMFATDAAGNVSPTIGFYFVKDTTIPAIPTILHPVAGTAINLTNYTALSFNGGCEAGATVNIGSTGVGYLQTTCSAAGTWQQVLDLSSYADGSVTISAYQTDAAGNQSTYTAQTYNKNTVAPASVAVTNSGAVINQSNVDAFTITGNCIANASIHMDGYNVTDIACSSGGTFAITTSYASASEGLITQTFTQKDSTGNSSPISSYQFLKDTLAPTSVAFSGVPTLTTGENITLTVSASDFYSYSYKVGPSGSTDCSVETNYSAPLSSGSPTIAVATSSYPTGGITACVIASDDHGNSAPPLMATWNNDLTPATVNITEVERTVLSTSGSTQFTLTLSSAKNYPVTVNYAVDGDAIYQTDYNLPTSGSVTIPAGSLSAAIVFGVLNNSSTTGISLMRFALTSTNQTMVMLGNANLGLLYIQHGSSLPTISKVAVGAKHMCAINSNSVLKCWGSNSYGQLGNGNTTSSSAPQIIDSGTTYQSVSTGAFHTCAITTAGVLKCWGDYNYGKLGISGASAYVTSPTIIDAGTLYTKVSAGDNGTCAITTSGILKCWGCNSYGEVGNGSNLTQTTPVTINSGTNYSVVAVGVYHTCAITSAGALQCWGNNASGELGDSRNEGSSPLPITVTSGTNYLTVAAGGGFTCAITSANLMKCWGAADNGEVGNGTTAAVYYPGSVDPSVTYSSVFAATNHACAITTAGLMKCWGQNNYGEIADGTNVTRLTPTAIDTGTVYSTAAVGLVNTCGITSSNALKCSGSNSDTQAPDGSAPVTKALTQVLSLSSYKAISTGYSHTCAINLKGYLECWGLNSDGQLGDTTLVNHLVPYKIDIPNTYSSIAAGAYHTCAINASQKIECWGDNSDLAVGNGSTSDQTAPVTIDSTNSYSMVATGDAQSCGITQSGVLRCWGYNQDGSLLGSGTTDVATPQTVDSTNSYNFVSIGSTHACAITATGRLRCWGRNDSGQLGNSSVTVGTAITQLTDIDAIHTYIYVAAGFNETCGITDSNDLYCWGSNTSGKLGDSTTTDRVVPTLIDSGVKYRKVTVAATYACGLTTSNVLKCWGSNSVYNLGTGNTTSTTTPTVIDSANAYMDISAKYLTTCGVTTANVLKCWGYNPYGQTGDGGTIWSHNILTSIMKWLVP